MSTLMTEAERPLIAEPERTAARFTYASGARPLDGFTIKRGIGRGGFGEVYYAVSDAGKEVALKLIKRNLEVELRGVRQCLNLKHPNLLALHDIRTDAQDDRWVVMEHISGESLADALERHPDGLPVAEALEWVRGIAAGVAYLHEHGIVHRDLKPGNIFRDEGIVKVGDYGLSKFVSCSRRSGQTESVGTVHYMAPEIANGRYGKEIDVYAMGIILYETLTGAAPFEGESVGEVLMKHLTAAPDLAKLPEPFRAIVGQALVKDPAQRLGGARDFLAVLPNPSTESAPPAFYNATNRSFQPPSADAPVTAELVGEEPIWRALRDSARQLNEQWTAANFHPIVKVAVVLGALFLLVSSAGVWFPLLFFGVMLYGVYRLVRALWHAQPATGPRIVTAQLVSTPPAAPPTRERRKQSWRRERCEEPIVVAQKSARQKVTELLGSMLVAAGVAAIMTVVAMVLRREEMAPAQFAWLALTGALGAWAVMLPAKIWEGQGREHAPRRFTMLVVGLVVGLAAFGLAKFLLVDLPFETNFRMPLQQHAALYEADGSPKLIAYLAYFGFLLFVVRWWRQADPLRAARVGLWSTAACLFAAWLLNFVWPFPQPWGFLLTAIIAVSVQLASPWTPRKGRP